MLRSLSLRIAAVAAAITLPIFGLVAPAEAESPYERGPDPTASSLLDNGTFSLASTSVSSLVLGFGGGTIYYPTSTSEGTYGGIVLAPGYTASSSMYASVARRVASHGFVVFAIDTNTRLDQPGSRGQQILAAVDYLKEDASSAVASRLDENRIAVSGHSMGGGGTLEAANQDSSIKAAVALQPWHTDKTWPGIRIPTMIIGAELDTIAPVATHSIPFYTSATGASEKAYGEINNADHLIANTDDDWQGRLFVTWMKRYLDEDTRYSQFLCPAPSSINLSDYRNTCPD
ncbi:dienelactone hydrolase [Nocardioides luteus]|uniref:Lipase n=1 Tax=Nocardioides luteus TaxID=1844 RepID=A0ABQ5SR52_9ACTN|nr:alpha/beta fold hydrolase [Nocardioides luteus]MDR7313074.1 dienelactone hydrolase [Nocardioides luteus]GGR44295.1 lipase [Nocardioides luteus]GLJ66135.1 lipase [Nocardioides luteus]